MFLTEWMEKYSIFVFLLTASLDLHKNLQKLRYRPSCISRKKRYTFPRNLRKEQCLDNGRIEREQEIRLLRGRDLLLVLAESGGKRGLSLWRRSGKWQYHFPP